MWSIASALFSFPSVLVVPSGSPARTVKELVDVPTMAEAGYAGVELEIWQGIVAPAGTPPAIVRKLNTELSGQPNRRTWWRRSQPKRSR